jgi:hypothetical protein
LIDQLGLKQPLDKPKANGADTDAKAFFDPATIGQPSKLWAGKGIGSLSEGLSDHWYDRLMDEQKDEVVHYVLEGIATQTNMFKLREHGGPGYAPKDKPGYMQLVFAIAASGAPHAEDYFVEFASQVEGADAPDVLRAKFLEIKSSSAAISLSARSSRSQVMPVSI